MKRTRENCLKALIPIEIGYDEVLVDVAFHFDAGNPGSWDEPKVADEWDVWSADIVRHPGNHVTEYLGEAPRWVIDSLQRDFENGGPVWEYARNAFEEAQGLAEGAKSDMEEMFGHD